MVAFELLHLKTVNFCQRHKTHAEEDQDSSFGSEKGLKNHSLNEYRANILISIVLT